MAEADGATSIPNHEDINVDEETVTLDRTKDDQFLSKLCGGNDTSDEVEAETEPTPQEHSVFNETTHWKKQKPILGMRFHDPAQLKNMLCNYAVANGYQLWFEKNDRKRLLAKCCRGECTFRLWATWMSDEHTFQIKSLKGDHSCARNFKLGSIVTYSWIGSHYTKEIIHRHKMSVRKLRLEVIKKFGIDVSVSQCRRAKKYALQQIEGTLVEHYSKLNELKIHQRNYQVLPSGLNQFEVRGTADAYEVDLDRKHCSCRLWQLNGYGCVHSVACISFLNRDVEAYVDSLFGSVMYMKSYNHSITPMNGSPMWPTTSYIPPLPPVNRRMPGRPVTKRKRATTENQSRHTNNSSRQTENIPRVQISKVGKKQKCGNCKGEGHNKRACPIGGRPTKIPFKRNKRQRACPVGSEADGQVNGTEGGSAEDQHHEDGLTTTDEEEQHMDQLTPRNEYQQQQYDEMELTPMEVQPTPTDEMQVQPTPTDEMQVQPTPTDEMQVQPTPTDEMQVAEGSQVRKRGRGITVSELLETIRRKRGAL